jgi:hypothetical protein
MISKFREIPTKILNAFRVGLLWMLIDLTYIQNISVKHIRYGFSTNFYDKKYLPVFHIRTS